VDIAEVGRSSRPEPTGIPWGSAAALAANAIAGRLVAPTSDGAEDPRAMLIDMAHDEFHDPGDIAARVTLGECDLVELLLRERPHERTGVLRGHVEQAQRLVPRWPAEPSGSTPVDPGSHLPGERARPNG